MRRNALSLLERYLPKKDRLRILEIGCGTGINLKYLARYGTPEGIEYDPYALRLSQESGYACRQGDMHNLDLPSEAYDLVAFFEVLNQARKESHESIVKSVAARSPPAVFSSCASPRSSPSEEAMTSVGLPPRGSPRDPSSRSFALRVWRSSIRDT